MLQNIHSLRTDVRTDSNCRKVLISKIDLITFNSFPSLISSRSPLVFNTLTSSGISGWGGASGADIFSFEDSLKKIRSKLAKTFQLFCRFESILYTDFFIIKYLKLIQLIQVKLSKGQKSSAGKANKRCKAPADQISPQRIDISFLSLQN